MARLKYPELAPEGYAALSAFGHYVNTGTALEPVLLGLVYLRASVLNGCHFCIGLHKAELRKHHEPPGRIDAVATGPASEAFTPREQAALRWTDAVTRLQGGEIGDDEFALVSRFFQGKELVDLTFAIANINAWNRMGVAFQPHWRPEKQGDTQPASQPASQGAIVNADQGVPPHSEAVDTPAEDDGGKVAFD